MIDTNVRSLLRQPKYSINRLLCIEKLVFSLAVFKQENVFLIEWEKIDLSGFGFMAKLQLCCEDVASHMCSVHLFCQNFYISVKPEEGRIEIRNRQNVCVKFVK